MLSDHREREIRRKILRATIAEIATKGYHATTVADIVASGHVSRSTFYALYGGKEDCFLEAYRKAQAALRRAVDQPLGSEMRDFEELFVRGVDTYLQLLFDNVANYQVFQQEIQVLGPAGVAARRHTYDAWADMILARVQEAFVLAPSLTRGRRVPSGATMVAVLFGLNELISREIDSGGRVPTGIIRHEVVRMLASAFSPDAVEETCNLLERFPYSPRE